MNLSTLLTEFTYAGFTLSVSDPSCDRTLTVVNREADNAVANILSHNTSERVFRVELFPNRDLELATVLHNNFDLTSNKIDSLLKALSSEIEIARASNKHFYREPKHCTSSHYQSCFVCDGGLAVCAICGHYEGALTTDCPGTYTYPQYGEAVYAGTIDFRNGAWRQALTSPHTPAHYKAQ